MVADETWYFTVHAIDDQGNEDLNIAERSYLVPDLEPPVFDTSTFTAAWNAGQDAIALSWTPPLKIFQYKVEAQCINIKESAGAVGTWPDVAHWPLTNNWYELATLGATATGYTLPRSGTSGTCAGAEYRSYRFRVHVRKLTSDWDTNTVLKPNAPNELIGAIIPDLTPPSWPSGAALAVLQTGDITGLETVDLTWPEATDVAYATPARSASGLLNYDIYLLRSTTPQRVFIKTSAGVLSGSNRTLTISAADMLAACNAPQTDPLAVAGTAITDATCRFAIGHSYTFAVRARDNVGNVHTQAQELVQANATIMVDITPPVLTQVAVSAAALYGSQSTTLTFTAGEAGTYRVRECTANCSGVGTPTYVTLVSTSGDSASGSMTAAVQKSMTFGAVKFSTGTGVKNLIIEFTDANGNAAIYTGSSTTAVPTVTINAPTITGSISVSPTTVTDAASFTVGFTSNQTGTYRILECTVANCSSTAELATSSMIAATPVSISLSASLFSAGITKILELEITDSIGNKSAFNNTTTPSVASITHNLTPVANVTGFKILKYNNTGVATFKLSWTLPASLLATDVVRIRKGTTTIPATCSTGTLIVDKTYTSTTHEVAVGADTVGNVSYAAFIVSAEGLCAAVGASYGAVWGLTPSVTMASDGYTGQYAVSTNINSASVLVATARSHVKISSWTGDNTAATCVSTGVGCGANADIAVLAYFAESSTALATANASSNITYDYSNDTNHPVWSKRYHRFYFSNSTGTNFELSDVYTYAKPPVGMVYVPASGWPQNVAVTGASQSITESYPTTATMGDWDAVPHDFAVDKYEPSLSGTLGVSTTFPNAETGVLISTPTLPINSKSWFAFKQGCLNRSYDATYSSDAAAISDLPTALKNSSSTIITNPRRKFHLATGVEWTVAAYGTPDLSGQDNCNSDGRTSASSTPLSPADTGTNSTVNCVSRFGARNMFGNLMERTDDLIVNGKRGVINKFVGTLAEHSVASPLVLPEASSNVGTWSFRSASKVLDSTNVSINGDYTYRYAQAGTTMEGGAGITVGGWVFMRGGSWASNAYAGRFYLNLTYSPAYATTGQFGGRCTIVAPQLRPRVAKFASESDTSTAKLAWITLDTENTTTIKLASAATKAEIDAFDGTNTPTNVTINNISLDSVTTGKHIGSGGCEAGYTPKAAGFANDTLGDNYWSGKYCANASGTTYYKLCATNPSIANVTDESTTLERTSCSAVVAVVATQTLPSLVAYSNAAKLQNDSDGAYARFYFNLSGGTNVVAKIVYGISIDEVKRWNGDDAGFNGFDAGTTTGGVYYGTLSGVKVIDVPASTFNGNGTTNVGGTADCATAELAGVYKPFTGGVGVTATHYACVNMSTYPKWTKMFFKVVFANSDAAGTITSGWQQSEIRGGGHAPSGMTYITREEWKSINNGGENYTALPVCVGSNGGWIPKIDNIAYVMPGNTALYNHGTVGCVYDYAMDKYEAYLSSGTLTAGTFNTTNTAATNYNTSTSDASSTTPATAMTGNTSAGILLSGKGQVPAASANWFGFTKGCYNRTAQIVTAGFLVDNTSPTNNVRLPTGVEWTVAAYNTPDNPAGEAITANNGNSACNVNSGAQNSTTAGAAFNNTGGMVNCVSTFGSYDHIGNVEEWTDEVTVDGTHAASTNFYHLIGTSHATAFPASGNGSVPALLLGTTTDNWVSTWDYLTGLISATTTSGTSYFWWPAATTVGPPAGGNGTGGNWGVIRGGNWSSGANSGRFAVNISNSPAKSYWTFGGRCSLLPP